VACPGKGLGMGESVDIFFKLKLLRHKCPRRETQQNSFSTASYQNNDAGDPPKAQPTITIQMVTRLLIF